MTGSLILAFASLFDVWPDASPRKVPADSWPGQQVEAAPVKDESPPERSERILFFTADWCGPCQQFKAESLPPLLAAGWSVGPLPSNTIQILDADANPDLVRRYQIEGLPAFVRVSGGRELRRITGKVDQWAIGRLFYGEPDAPAPVQPRSSQRSGLLNFLFEE